jgi:hypothetical protein
VPIARGAVLSVPQRQAVADRNGIAEPPSGADGEKAGAFSPPLTAGVRLLETCIYTIRMTVMHKEGEPL